MSKRKLATATATIIFDSSNRILAVTRRNTRIWCLPGGKVDAGETDIDGALREVFEETGFDLNASDLVPVYSSIVFGDDLNDFYCVAYLCKVARSARTNIDQEWEIEKGIICKFISVDELLTSGIFAEYNLQAINVAQEFILKNKDDSSLEEASRLQILVDHSQEAQAMAKIMKDFADGNPKSLMLKELEK